MKLRPSVDTERLRVAIRASPELCSLESRLDDLLPHVKEIELEPGENLFREGDVADAVYVVAQGSVQAVGTTRRGNEVVLRLLTAGEALGEQAVIAGGTGRRKATIRAVQDTVLYRLDRTAFRRVIPKDDPTYQQLQALSDRYKRQDQHGSSELARLLASAAEGSEVSFSKGTTIFNEGDDADRIYLILEGTAAVYKGTDQNRVLLGHMHPGRCVGELGLLHQSRRFASVVAETDLRVLEVRGQHFMELLQASPELQQQMRALERVYQLPNRGIVTQYSGQVMGEEAITTLYHLADGREYAASLVADSGLFHLERLVPPIPGDLARLEYDDVVLVVDPAGSLLQVTASSGWPDLLSAHLLAIDGVQLTGAQVQTFAATGRLAGVGDRQPDLDAEPVVCACMHVTAAAVDAAIFDGFNTLGGLSRELGCGTVCGRCNGQLAELLNRARWTDAEIVESVPITKRIRAVRLRPHGPLKRWRPGQHVVVSVEIDGQWVERPYTISGSPGDPWYEITVLRERRGLLSSWFFEDGGPGDRVQISQPQGEASWELGYVPTLCFVAGIGVTPLVAGCRALDPSRYNASIYVDYSGHVSEELAYVAELSAIERVALSVRETARAGRLTAADVRQLVSLQPGAKVCICGPPTYIADVVEWARAAGVPAGRILTEVFTPVGEPPDVDAPAATTAEEGLSAYETCLRTSELLALQQDPDVWPHGDAMLFQIVHQTSELWLKEATLELSRCAGSLRRKEAAPAIRLLRRVIDCVKVVTVGLDMLEHISPWEYQELRKALAGGSGFDSPGFRGLRSVAPAVGELFHDLHEEQGLALVDVYIRGREFEDLYQIAESLTELDERLTTWRMRHYKVAERVIGGTGVGTQGTPLHVLRDLMLTSLFPELWQVRNELTARS